MEERRQDGHDGWARGAQRWVPPGGQGGLHGVGRDGPPKKETRKAEAETETDPTADAPQAAQTETAAPAHPGVAQEETEEDRRGDQAAKD